MTRSLRRAGLIAALVVVGCSGSLPTNAPGSAAPEATPTTSLASAKPDTEPSASATKLSSTIAPTVAASHPVTICTSEQTDGGPGDRGPGTLSGSIATGRILISLESDIGKSGTYAVEYIDPAGLHEIKAEPDWTFAHGIWDGPNDVLFDSERNGDRRIFRLSLSDGSVDQLTDGSLIAQEKSALFPDGSFVHSEYSCEQPYDLGLHISTPDGSTSSQLTPARTPGDPGGDDQATVSPNGQSVAFLRYTSDNAGGGLFVVNVESGAERRLTEDSAAVSHPSWSPDGKTIVYSAPAWLPDGNPDVWTIPASGGDPVRIGLLGSAFAVEPTWSPDGTQIVFVYWSSGWDHNELRVMDADGSNMYTLWTGEGQHAFANTPNWGP